MTIHGTPWSSIQNAITRQDVRVSHRHVKHKRIRDKEAYAAAIEFNRQNGVARPERPPNKSWNALRMHKTSRRAVTLANQPQPAFIDEYQEAEERMKVRAKKAVEMLWFGIEELVNVRPEKPTSLDAQQINVAFMIATVQRLCKYAQIPTPELPEFRKPGAISNRKCLDCGAPLSPNETWDLCSDCRPDTSAIKAVSEVRREREREERKAKAEVKRLASLIRKVEKGVR